MNKYALRKSPLTLVIGSLLSGGTVNAATIMVDTTADTVGVNCSLRAAIINANNNDQSGSAGCAAGDAGLDEIRFDPAMEGATITLGGTELPFVTEALTITGPGSDNPSGITIDGDSASRIFIVSGADSFTMSNATLTGGYAMGGQSGGAIASFTAELELDHMLISGNTAGIEGGGVAVHNGHNAILQNSTVRDNQTAGSFGRGGGLWVSGDAELTNSVISGNSTVGSGPGGGLAVGGEVGLYGSTVSGNYTTGDAAEGGGLAAVGNVTLKYSTVSGNSTFGYAAYGGGVFSEAGNVRAKYSTVSGNSTEGVYAYGGGIAAYGGSVTIQNSTISGNSASGEGATGGGVAAVGQIRSIHGTSAFNTAAGGVDGLHLFGPYSLELTNSLVVQAGAGETACSQVADTLENSLATDASCTGAATTLPDVGLEPLADNGGPTETHALGNGSVAIDGAGDCEKLFTLTEASDQRGQPRPGFNSEACDIGAFELGGEVLFRDRFQQD